MSSNTSKAVSRVKDRMRSGAVLMEMNSQAGKKFYIVGRVRGYAGSGREVPDHIARAVIDEPDVRPGQDGLFPGISKTYHI
jgi:hypothetical protein